MGTTANMGIPYPESTDYVADGATAIQNLAEKVDEKTGLVFIKSETLPSSGTLPTSVEITDVFSADFDSYYIDISLLKHSANQPDIAVRLGTAATSYNWAGVYLSSTSGSLTTTRALSDTSMSIVSGNNAGTGSYSFVLRDPYKAARTFMSSTNMSSAWWTVYQGWHDTTSSYTSFTLLPSTGTISQGTVRVYGYLNG